MTEPFDPFDVATQEAEAEESAKARALSQQVGQEDLARLMSEKWGRRIVWRLLERTGMYRTSFTGDASATFFNEGQRNIGLFLSANVQAAAPALYGVMLAENAA